MKRALKWLWDNADTIGIGCMWFVAAIDLVVRRKLDDACVWAMFAIVCSVQNRHRAELDRLRIEANVTHRMIAAIVAEQARAVKCVHGVMIRKATDYEVAQQTRVINAPEHQRGTEPTSSP